MRPFPFFYRFFEAREESSFVISLLDAAARVSRSRRSSLFSMKNSVSNFASMRISTFPRIKMAEGVGFEPTVGYPTLDFESSALNRTQPPFPFSQIAGSQR
jgi:hypothetical protein